MTLAELQASFQDAVLNTAQPMPASILPSRDQTAAARFEIYQDAYRLRLTEFLSADYPVLKQVLGDESFNELAGAYIAATPSSFRNARWYGRGLPDFMRIHSDWQEPRAFADLALFERSLSDAFDAEDGQAIEAAALGTVDPENQPHLRFAFQASLILLNLAQGVVGAYEAMMEERDAQPPSDTDEETVLIWRDPSQQAFYRVLETDEALALDSASHGATFAEICGLLSLRMPEEDAANQAALFLIRWFGDGLLSGLQVKKG